MMLELALLAVITLQGACLWGLWRVQRHLDEATWLSQEALILLTEQREHLNDHGTRLHSLHAANEVTRYGPHGRVR